MPNHLHLHDDPPPMAAAYGYNTRTFGPKVTMDTSFIDGNMYDFDLLASPLVPGMSHQLGNGAVLLPGASGNGYGASICTAKKGPPGGPVPNFIGTVYGGGLYMEAEFFFTPTLGPPGVLPFPAFWLLEIGQLCGNPPKWTGKNAPPNATRWVEVDPMQWVRDSLQYYAPTGLIDWNGPNPTQTFLSAGVENGAYCPAKMRSGGLSDLLFSTPQRYGWLWVPATPSTKGFMKSYLNRVEVHPAVTPAPIEWNLYSDDDPFPPVWNVTTGNVIDHQQLAVIFGTAANDCPFTLNSLEIWQTSTAANQTRLPAPGSLGVEPGLRNFVAAA
jgi:hypothetical protein